MSTTSFMQVEDYNSFKKFMHELFIKIDAQILEELDKEAFSVGSTALVVFHFDEMLITVNLGDSRAVLSRSLTPFVLSSDHNCFNDKEQIRIIQCGGKITDNRIMGVLSVTRSFGDFQFKTQSGLFLKDQDIVICTPDVTFTSLRQQTDEFLIVASDGLFSIMTNDAVISTVGSTYNSHEEYKAQIICQELVQIALKANISKLGDSDNISLFLVFLNRGQFRQKFWEK